MTAAGLHFAPSHAVGTTRAAAADDASCEYGRRLTASTRFACSATEISNLWTKKAGHDQTALSHDPAVAVDDD
jgi:hypothetical protein